MPHRLATLFPTFRLAALLGVGVALAGCAIVPTEHGRAYLVGDVAYSTGGEQGCTIGSFNRSADYGKTPEDIGKHSIRMRDVTGKGVCYAGSGITDNLKAALAFLAGLLL